MMGNKRNLLFINKTQFGYHTDYYKYAEYLRNNYNITFLCFDTGLKRLELEDVRIEYVSYRGPKLIRGVRFMLASLSVVAFFKGIIFINYFEKCKFLYKMFPNKKMILDVRTLSVHTSANIRNTYNRELKEACSLFDFVTVISEGVRKELNLNILTSAILPLGSDIISDSDKSFKSLKLLYVGTLSGRNISDTLIGLNTFIQNNLEVTVTYDIVGDGTEYVFLEKLISELGLENVVTLHGRIPHFELKPFFDSSNVGVSYIPLTDYYNFQPPTKTFEYILSGMPCIGTSTCENKSLITSQNGVLCYDNPISFAKALQQVFENKGSYKSQDIRYSLRGYTWENIVSRKLEPVINKIMLST